MVRRVVCVCVSVGRGGRGEPQLPFGWPWVGTNLVVAPHVTVFARNDDSLSLSLSCIIVIVNLIIMIVVKGRKAS